MLCLSYWAGGRDWRDRSWSNAKAGGGWLSPQPSAGRRALHCFSGLEMLIN